MDKTKAQQMMVEDGFPPELLISQDQREKDWKETPPKPMPSFNATAKSQDQATLQLLAEMEQAKKNKAGNRIAKMLSKKEDRTGKRWDSRKGKWVPDELQKGANTMISITTNTRGSTQMAKKDYAEMTGPELVEAYNKISGKPPIKKFKDKAAGLAAMSKIETEKAAKKKMSAASGKTSGEKKPKEASANKLAAEFEARVGSFREKLLIALDDNYRKMVKTEDLLKSVYGSKNNENTGALTMVIKGATTTIEKKKLPYELKKEKGEDGISYGLYPKS